MSGTQQRKHVWNELLDADMNVRYWRYLTRRYSAWDKFVKILLTVFTLGTVASWLADYPVVLKVVSGLSAVIAFILPNLNWAEDTNKMASLIGSWTEQMIGYNQIWDDINDNPANDFQKRLSRLDDTRVRLNTEEAILPNDKKLKEKCQEEVKKARGFGNVENK